jgi:hypothetical protein
MGCKRYKSWANLKFRLNLERKTFFGTAQFFSFLVGFGIFSIIALLQLLRPIKIPFADDWLVLNYLTHGVGSNFTNIFRLVNGHQIALSKILFWLIGVFNANPIELVGILNLFFLAGSLYLLSKYSIKNYKVRKNLPTQIIILILILPLKPMQNYFMPICSGWVQAIFFIGLFLTSKKMENKRDKIKTMLSILFAPFTIGLGLTIPIAQIFSSLSKVNNRKNNRKIEVFFIFLSFVSILISYVLPHLIYKSPNSTSRNLPSAIDLPWEIVKFIFTLLGSPFVPASRFDSWLPMTVGMSLASLLIAFLRKNKINSFFHATEQSLIPIGLIFTILLVLTRFQGAGHEPIISAAPRYVSGTSLLILGYFLLIQDKLQIQLRYFLLVIAFVILLSGLKTGLEWQSIRFKESNQIVKCLNDNLPRNQDTCIMKLNEYALVDPNFDFKNAARHFLNTR